MANAFFGERSLTGAAAARTVDALIRATAAAGQAPAYAGSGIGCALNFYANVDIYVSNSPTVTDAGGGAILPAGTPFVDYATGMMGNVCDPTLWYLYAAADATVTVMFRAM